MRIRKAEETQGSRSSERLPEDIWGHQVAGYINFTLGKVVLSPKELASPIMTGKITHISGPEASMI